MEGSKLGKLHKGDSMPDFNVLLAGKGKTALSTVAERASKTIL
jgi:hypothetical protein